MKSRKNNFLLYVVIVIFPILIGVLYNLNDTINRDYSERREQAIWTGTVHQRSWDQFIAETVTSLDILSFTAEMAIEAPLKLESILKKMHSKEPRYGGIYLLDENGTVITGSNSLLSNMNLSDHDYVQEIIETKDIIISNHYEVLKNGKKVIGIGKPVMNENGKIDFIIIAHLRVDYLQNIMRLLTPDTRLSVINSNGAVIMGINTDNSINFTAKNSVLLPIDRLPWSIQVKIPQREKGNILKTVSIDLLRFIFIFHILFLFIKYMMLKREAAREKKENELQKLELVGTLAASTAHEIRNPLTGIKGLVQLLSEKYTNSQDQYYFDIINDEISRINEIVSEFLILGKPTAQKTEIIDIRNILKELEPLILSEANLNNVQYELTLSKTPLLVDCTKDQIKQVLLNISKNALESMTRGGHLTIKLFKEQDKCHIQIADTGTGIPEEDIEKIFQPFYTSKDFGTGLGLVVCKRILHSFGGNIKITSSVNKGTIVDVILPSQS
ncbi:ATP-binding protein [Bacillus sp. DTU_2020_1000418_1_SI_GHA_SEK_038]|uniref:ATP-binding protein n=1 Tax=Bacillus sp. DTU_2020_1000418_1_SI_GHA_SEK_038 TaxID=3077585 RepID=UPI0028E7E44B|nr:ATP-binding protein [Bacillus sp. DTU_2020_1000418_1_SI_GHA_SEK_038]WNS76967.1 ATP-binding protein [Bacillus sp. DTU_2020_1000418_1_SI_GHA_SEK_038]